jgi:hypothetical protein
MAVDEHDDVGGALAQPLGDVQTAAAGADRPVDGAQLVARHVGPDTAVFDAPADVAGQVGSEAVEQFGSGQCGGLCCGDGEHEHLGDRHVPGRGRSGEQAAPARHVHPHGHRIPAPPRRRRHDLEPARRSAKHLERGARRHVDGQADGRPVVGVRPEFESNLLVLEAAHQARFGVHPDRRLRPLPAQGHQDTDHGGGEHHELPPRADQRHRERHRRARGERQGQL